MIQCNRIYSFCTLATLGVFMNDYKTFSIKEDCRLSINMADFADVKPPYIHFKRKPTEYIFYYIFDGELDLKEGNQSFCLKPDDAILLDIDHTHIGLKSTACKFFYCHFNTEIKADGLDNYVLPKYISINNEVQKLDIRTTISKLVRINKEQRYMYANICKVLFKEILLLLASCYHDNRSLNIDSHKNRARLKVPELVYFLNLNYAQNITSDLLSEKFNFNFDYLNRQFKLETGNTIFNYLSDIRIEHAKDMIRTRLYTLSDVATACGFSDVYYFNKVFKKYTGITPGKF